jgi:hypothetical protein
MDARTLFLYGSEERKREEELRESLAVDGMLPAHFVAGPADGDTRPLRVGQGSEQINGAWYRRVAFDASRGVDLYVAWRVLDGPHGP